MNRAAKIAAAVAVMTVAGLVALAAPPVVAAVSWASERLTPAASAPADPTESGPAWADPAGSDSTGEPAKGEGLFSSGDGISRPAGGPGDCTASAFINIRSDGGGPSYGKLLGELVEMGPSELASGSTILDAGGAVIAYEVAPGDSLIAVGERFCVDYITVGSYNHARGSMIHPGDVLYLRPDPTIPWVDPYVPYDSQPGSSTIAYYDAVSEFTNVVAARDLASARRVWDRLAPDVDPVARAVVDQALSESDWTLLRQMFP